MAKPKNLKIYFSILKRSQGPCQAKKSKNRSLYKKQVKVWDLSVWPAQRLNPTPFKSIRARVGIKHFEINYAPAAMKRSSRTTDAQQLKGKKMRNKKMGKKTNPAEFDKRIQPFVSNVVQVMLKDLPAECDT